MVALIQAMRAWAKDKYTGKLQPIMVHKKEMQQPGDDALLESVIRPNILAIKGPLLNVPNYPNHIQRQPRSILDRNENNLGSCLSRHDELYSGDLSEASSPSDEAFPSPTLTDGTSPSSRSTSLFPSSQDATLAFAETQSLHRYPAPCMWRLKQQVAEYRNLPESYMRNIVLANGSAELIDILMRTTCVPRHDAILLTPPTFPLYNDRAAVNDVAVVESRLRFVDGDFHIDIPEILELLADKKRRIKLVFIATPGNPTGSIVPLEQIERLLKAPAAQGTLIVVDEAYIDFAPASCKSAISLLGSYPNLVVLQTLSKSHGLAGTRFGMAFAHRFVAEMMHRVQMPFAVPTPTLAIASKALSPAFRRGHKAAMAGFVDCRRSLLEDLGGSEELLRRGVGPPIGGGHGNFVVLPVGDNERALWTREMLRKEFDTSVGFIGSLQGCEGCLRITVGSREENQRLVGDLVTLFSRE